MMSFLIQAALAASVSVSPTDDLAALTSSLGPGDSVVFTDGVYELENTLTIEALGEEGARIEIFPQEGANPVLKSLNGSTIFRLQNSEYVTVRGLSFIGPDTWEEEGGNGVEIRDSVGIVFEDNLVQNVRGTMLVLGGDGSGYSIRRNLLEFTSNGHGIYAGCGDGSCWLQDSSIENNVVREIIAENWLYGIYLDNGSQANTVTDNVVYNMTGSGIRVESTQFGDANWVERNAVWNGDNNGIEVYGGARVRNNVVFEMGGYGIRSGNPDNDDLADTVITYNTVALTGDYGVRLDDWPGRDGMVFSSNCIANITGRGFYFGIEEEEEDTTSYITKNVISGLVENVDLSLYPGWYAPGSGVADFADVEAWDFYPVTQSPLVGSADADGAAWIPDVDFNGSSRNGNAPTVGAYEWDGEGNPGWVIQEGFKDPEAAVRGPGGLEPGGGCCKSKEDGTEAFLLLPLLAFGLKRRRRSADA